MIISKGRILGYIEGEYYNNRTLTNFPCNKNQDHINLFIVRVFNPHLIAKTKNLSELKIDK